MHTFKHYIAHNITTVCFKLKAEKRKSVLKVCVYLRARVCVVVFGGGLLQHGTELPGQLVGCSQRCIQVIINTLDWIQTTKSSIEILAYDNTPRCINMHWAEMTNQDSHSMLLPKLVWELMAVRSQLFGSWKKRNKPQLSGEQSHIASNRLYIHNLMRFPFSTLTLSIFLWDSTCLLHGKMQQHKDLHERAWPPSRFYNYNLIYTIKLGMLVFNPTPSLLPQAPSSLNASATLTENFLGTYNLNALRV